MLLSFSREITCLWHYKVSRESILQGQYYSFFDTEIPCNLAHHSHGHHSPCTIVFLFLLLQRSRLSWMLTLLSFCRTWEVFLPARYTSHAVPIHHFLPISNPLFLFFPQVFYWSWHWQKSWCFLFRYCLPLSPPLRASQWTLQLSQPWEQHLTTKTTTRQSPFPRLLKPCPTPSAWWRKPLPSGKSKRVALASARRKLIICTTRVLCTQDGLAPRGKYSRFSKATSQSRQSLT